MSSSSIIALFTTFGLFFMFILNTDFTGDRNHKKPAVNVVGKTPEQQKFADYEQRIEESKTRITNHIIDMNREILMMKRSGEKFDEEYIRSIYKSRINLEEKAIQSYQSMLDTRPITKEEIENRRKK